MKLRLNIRKKILFSFMAFAFLLLLVVVNFFYFQTVNNIKERALSRSVRTASQFKIQMDKNIDDSFVELKGIVYFGLKGTLVSNPDFNRKLHENIVNLFSIFPAKYSKLILIKFNSAQISVFTPLRLFNGKITVEEKSERISFLSPSLIRKISVSNKKRQIIRDASKSGKELILVSPVRRTNDIKLIAFLHTEKIAGKALRNLSLPDNESVFLYDKDNRIVFSSEKVMINRLIGEVPFGQKKEFVSAFKKYPEIDMNIAALTNTSSETGKLLEVIKQVIYFSAAIFVLIFGLIYIISGRISKSLNKITEAAGEIAAGEFSHKIDVEREDELGTLVNSFNKMAENLEIMFNKLNESNKELERKIKELTDTKIELSEKQRLALIGETVSKISHEIQNKMSGISIWVQNLEMQAESGSPLRLYVNEIKTALASFMNLLVNFKKFYRRPQLLLAETDIEELVNNILKKYSQQIEEKEIKVEKLFPENSPAINIDKGMIEETIENILLNAIFFTPQKGKIKFSLIFKNGKIEINICNTGKAITVEPPNKIFQPFFTTKSSGSGLGLAICKNAVEAHGGKILVHNKENEGVCFTIIFPETSAVKKATPQPRNS